MTGSQPQRVCLFVCLFSVASQLGADEHVERFCSKYGPGTGSISIAWDLVQNADSQSQLRPAESQPLAVGHPPREDFTHKNLRGADVQDSIRVSRCEELGSLVTIWRSTTQESQLTRIPRTGAYARENGTLPWQGQ